MSYWKRALITLRNRLFAKVWLWRTNLGPKVQAAGRVRVRAYGRIDIAARACFDSGPTVSDLVANPGGHLSIGESTMFNYGCILEASGRITIGARCLIGHYVMIMDCDMHGVAVADRGTRPPPRPITIEDDVWICSRAMILPGVTIGTGSVVGAGSIVTKSVPPFTLVAGNPAKVIQQIPQGSQLAHLAPPAVANAS